MLLPPLAEQLKGQPCSYLLTLVIMRRPRRSGQGVLSPRRAPNLGKIRRRACLRLIPFPGTGDVLLAPTMISHPLAYVAPTTRQKPCLSQKQIRAFVGRKKKENTIFPFLRGTVVSLTKQNRVSRESKSAPLME